MTHPEKGWYFSEDGAQYLDFDENPEELLERLSHSEVDYSYLERLRNAAPVASLILASGRIESNIEKGSGQQS